MLTCSQLQTCESQIKKEEILLTSTTNSSVADEIMEDARSRCDPNGLSPEKWLLCRGKGLQVIPEPLNFNTVSLLMLSNKIEKIMAKTFPMQLTKLHEITFASNLISYIEPGAFNGIAKVLEYLFLNNNRLTTIEPSVFRDLTILAHLDLRNNNIHTIFRGAFEKMLWLETFRLEGNVVGCTNWGCAWCPGRPHFKRPNYDSCKKCNSEHLEMIPGSVAQDFQDHIVCLPLTSRLSSSTSSTSSTSSSTSSATYSSITTLTTTETTTTSISSTKFTSSFFTASETTYALSNSSIHPQTEQGKGGSTPTTMKSNESNTSDNSPSKPATVTIVTPIVIILVIVVGSIVVMKYYKKHREQIRWKEEHVYMNHSYTNTVNMQENPLRQSISPVVTTPLDSQQYVLDGDEDGDNTMDVGLYENHAPVTDSSSHFATSNVDLDKNLYVLDVDI
eukprot:m.44584 g.44584  ORF g.44584 m.44584 type:complete len:447 (+) comp10118_c0_seq1:195-1535(+)